MQEQNEQDIEIMLKQEMFKLKTAIAYIEEAKEIAKASAEHLNEMKATIYQKEELKTDLENRFKVLDESQQHILSIKIMSIENKYIALLEDLKNKNETTLNNLKQEVFNRMNLVNQ